jgi:ribosomal-protein-alanine N-acetyltransferase
MLDTPRLILIPATIPIARAEIADRAVFSSLLGAAVPENWPPESLADALPYFLARLETSPGSSGWLGWYGILGNGSGAGPVLVASGGFFGPPDSDGTVEMGYSVLPQNQGNGYATEMMRRLLRWAFEHPGVMRIIARTTPENRQSIRVLNKLGFTESREGSEPGGIGFEITREHHREIDT